MVAINHDSDSRVYFSGFVWDMYPVDIRIDRVIKAVHNFMSKASL